MIRTSEGPLAVITRDIYEKSPAGGVAAVVSGGYIGKGPARVEVKSYQSTSDWTEGFTTRRSPDNGRTWSEWAPTDDFLGKRGNLTLSYSEFARCYDPVADKVVRMMFQRILIGKPEDALSDYWRGKTSYYDHMFCQVSDDNGETWGPMIQLNYEKGPAFDPDNWGVQEYFDTNAMYGGYSIWPMRDGGLAYGASVNVLHSESGGPEELVCGAVCLVGRWDPAASVYKWESSEPVAVSTKISSRGLMEICPAELANGDLVLEMRGSNTDTTPGRKWICRSNDRGRHFSPVSELRYDDGQLFYAPSTFAKLIRSTKNGRLYWIGNISETPPQENYPRYPLFLAEAEEESFSLKRGTLTIIDDYDPASDTVQLQLSNFSLLENRETLDFELYLSRYGEKGDGKTFTGDFWTSDCYKYVIRLK